MNTENYFDMVILGGGPAGTSAAFRAVEAGMKTALVESGFLGGTCLNVGCIPTKYLLGGTAALPLLSVQKKYKVAQGDIQFSLEALQSRKDRYIKGTRQALEKQLREAGVTLFSGKGLFDGQQSLNVKSKEGEQRLSFGKCIVATGSAPASFPGLKPDGATVCGSASLLCLTQIPENLIIVGAGAIGLELGEIFHRFGTKIILCDLAPRVLSGEDPEISEAVHAYHSREGWIIHTGRRIESLSTVDGQSELHFSDGERIRAAMSLVAVGRRSTASMLAPEKAGLALHPKGWLAAGADLRCAEHVYAVGDVNGRVLLAHAADHQARYAVAHAAGNAVAEYTPPPMPSCIYGSMEVMRVGPTLKELQAENGDAIFQSRAALAGNAIAQSYGHPQGFVRMLWRNETIVSISAVGHGVSHLVSAAALLIGKKIQKNVPLPLIFAHPTLDEALESAIVATKENIQ
jgi:dihydrolipoamide dehydrogenase